MIGDLIPEGHKHWELLLSLLGCMEMIFSPALTEEAVIFLQHLTFFGAFFGALSRQASEAKTPLYASLSWGYQ